MLECIQKWLPLNRKYEISSWFDFGLKMTMTGRSHLKNFFKKPVYFYSCYTYSKIDKKFTVTDEENSMFIRLLSVKDTSGMNLRTSHPHL